MLVDGNSATPNYNILTASNTIDLQYLYPGNPPSYPDDFVLQGSQIAQNSDSSCPAWNGHSSAWKGKVNPSGFTAASIPPFQIPVDTGNGNIDSALVSICTTIYGASADPTGTSATTSKCYLLVPIAAPPNPTNQANIVTLGCFRIYPGSNGLEKWRGVLYPVSTNTCDYGVYQPSWHYGNSFSETQVMLTH
jgi:hypothetical protein